MSIESYKAGYIDGSAAELHYKQRCEQLEQLCRDLWTCYSRGKCAYCEHYRTKYDQDWCNLNFQERMDALGLLKGDAE